MKKHKLDQKKVVIVVNDINFFFSHRLNIASYAQDQGFAVIVACPFHARVSELHSLGFGYSRYDVQRGLKALFFDLFAMLQLLYTFVTVKPTVVHLITAKPILFGGLLARVLGVPAVAAVSGLGHAYSAVGTKHRIIRSLMNWGYKAALRHQNVVAIFQNSENLGYFQANKLVGDDVRLFRGSGTKLSIFGKSKPHPNQIPKIIMPCRMLKTKGVEEFIEAARIVNRNVRRGEFILAGSVDVGNPATVTENYLKGVTDSGDATWIGYQHDIAGLLSEATMVVLPSFYNEGLPKTLIDAAAAGRAVITTDIAGCRDAIIPDETGLLVKPRDAADLATKIGFLLDNPDECWKLGSAGRKLAESEYCDVEMAKKHIAIYSDLVARKDGHGQT
jgi:glycosyltransferase involved in cell wall biosynthesis